MTGAQLRATYALHSGAQWAGRRGTRSLRDPTPRILLQPAGACLPLQSPVIYFPPTSEEPILLKMHCHVTSNVGFLTPRQGSDEEVTQFTKER